MVRSKFDRQQLLKRESEKSGDSCNIGSGSDTLPHFLIALLMSQNLNLTPSSLSL